MATTLPFMKRTLVQQSFHAGGLSGALALNTSHVQLFNPIASNLLIVVQSIRITTAIGNGGVVLSEHGTALTNLDRNGRNKFIGAAPAIGEVRNQQQVAPLGTIIMALERDDAQGLTGAPIDLIFDANEDPMIIPEGNGILVRTLTLDEQIRAYFQWVEVPE